METTTGIDVGKLIEILDREFSGREIDVLTTSKAIHFAARDDRNHIVTVSEAGIRGNRPDGDGDYVHWTA
jgi:hypothetical protein